LALFIYILLSDKELNLLAKLEEIGYTSSVWKFCWDAVIEKLERSMKDYEGPGRIISDKLLKEGK
jgi:hypothetical protein